MDNANHGELRAARLIIDLEQSAMAYKRARKAAARAEAFGMWRKALRELADIQSIPVQNSEAAAAASAGR